MKKIVNHAQKNAKKSYNVIFALSIVIIKKIWYNKTNAVYLLLHQLIFYEKVKQRARFVTKN